MNQAVLAPITRAFVSEPRLAIGTAIAAPLKTATEWLAQLSAEIDGDHVGQADAVAVLANIVQLLEDALDRGSANASASENILCSVASFALAELRVDLVGQRDSLDEDLIDLSDVSGFLADHACTLRGLLQMARRWF